MIFLLTATASHYTNRDVNRLMKYGFRFELEPKVYSGPGLGRGTKNYWHKNGTPWRRLGNSLIDISTLEDLIEFQKAIKSSIIINGNEIEIYNDFRE